MPICSPGTSAPQLGVQRIVVLSTATVEALLAFLTDGLALVLAPIIATFAFDTTQICGSDPPPDPGLTANDVFDAISPTSSIDTMTAAWAKIHQWFLSWYWWDVCTCVGATTPAPPTPSNPGNIVSYGGTGPSGPNTSPCWNVNVPFSAAAGLGGFVDYATYSITPNLNPLDCVAGGIHHLTTEIPTGVTSFTVTVTGDALATSPTGFYGINSMLAYNNSCTNTGNMGSCLASHTQLTTTTTVTAYPAGTTRWAFDIANSDTVDHTFTVNFTFFCSGQNPIGVTTPCCPPDPAVSQMLGQILQLLQGIWVSLPSNPNSFANSTVHSGLSGSGSFALGAGTLAVKVAMTTIPNAVGEIIGTPITYLDAGWITSETSGSNYKSRRITHSPQIMPVDQLADTLNYTLENGVVATITELVKGP